LSYSGQDRAVLVTRRVTYKKNDMRRRGNGDFSSEVKHGCNNSALDLLGGVHIRNAADE